MYSIADYLYNGGLYFPETEESEPVDDIFNDSVSIPLPALLDLEEAGREPFT